MAKTVNGSVKKKGSPFRQLALSDDNGGKKGVLFVVAPTMSGSRKTTSLQDALNAQGKSLQNPRLDPRLSGKVIK